MFRFRLQRILELRRIETDRLRLVMSRAERSRREAQARLEAARTERAEHDERCRRTENRPLGALDLRARLSTSTSLAAREEAASTALRSAEQELERVRGELLETHRKVRSLERLRERRWSEYVSEIEAQERRQLDDIQRRSPEDRPAAPASPARRPR